jgi:catechol 2,3-dioxygenase-like lactoylglutathione lyase family enzyme
MTQATATHQTAITDAPIHPSLATRDLAKARAWYADKLGWEPMIEAPGTLVYEVGASNFTLYESEFAGTAKNTVMNWVVRDLPATVARLRDNGVTFEEYDNTVDSVAEFGPIRAAWFKDSEGNLLNLIEGITAMSA